MEKFDVNQARRDFVADADKQIARLESELASLSNVLLGQGWIVRNEGVHIKFEMKDNVCGAPSVCPVWSATRFSEGDAKRVAAVTFNGRNNPAEAVHITTALRDQLNETKRIRDEIAAKIED